MPSTIRTASAKQSRYPSSLILKDASGDVILSKVVNMDFYGIGKAAGYMMRSLSASDRGRVTTVEHHFDGGSQSGEPTVNIFPWNDDWKFWFS